MTQSKGKRVKSILKWIFFSILIVEAIMFIFTASIVGGLAMMLSGILLIPPLYDRFLFKIGLWKKRAFRIIVISSIFTLSIIIIGTSSIEKSIKYSSDVEVPIDLPTNKVFNLDNIYFDENSNEIQPDSSMTTYKVLEVLDSYKNHGRTSSGNQENLKLLIEVNNFDSIRVQQLMIQLKKDKLTFAPQNSILEIWTDKESYKLDVKREVYKQKTHEELFKRFQVDRIPFVDKYDKLIKKWENKHNDKISKGFLGLLYSSNMSEIRVENRFEYYPLKNK